MNFTYLYRTTVGKKQLVALSGIALSLFVLMHMAGNLFLFVGPEAYNRYSHALVSNPLIYAAEVALVLIFLVHVAFAISLTKLNKQAHGTSPWSGTSGAKGISFASKTMALTGLFIFAFLILHLRTLKFGPQYEIEYDGVVMRDLYRLVAEKFQSPVYTSWYIVCLVLLGLHLSHGISSLFQSLGITGARRPMLRRFAYGFAIVVAGGFILQPLYMMCCSGVTP